VNWKKENIPITVFNYILQKNHLIILRILVLYLISNSLVITITEKEKKNVTKILQLNDLSHRKKIT
jgi:hypothetical protein